MIGTFFFENINNLPLELISIVSSYIPEIAKMPLNRDFYKKNHYLFRNYINKKNMEKYIRKTIIIDHDYVFECLLVENFKNWMMMKKYLYKECIYANYLIFIESFCVENQSKRCLKLIFDLTEKLGLSKNKHKKNLIRNVRWTP